MNLVHYWINLSRSIKRRVFMENQFNNRNIKNYRVSAITPDDFDILLENKIFNKVIQDYHLFVYFGT